MLAFFEFNVHQHRIRPNSADTSPRNPQLKFPPEQPEAASLQAEDLSPEFRELGEKISLLASTVQDLTNQLQQKAEALEMENQVLMDNIQAMDEISWALEQSNQQLRINLNLVNALTDYTHNMIFVYSAETGRDVHTNQPARWFQKEIGRAHV